MTTLEPQPFLIGPGSEALAVIRVLGDWLFGLGFGEDSPDLGHRLYTKCKRAFGEGQYRLNGDDLERFGSAWGVVVAANEVERFLYEDTEG